MKIAHISDIHWRSTTRHEEYTRAFNKLFEDLKNEKPDLIVCTGDIYHTKTQGITPEVVDKMVWMFCNLYEIAPIRVILGNHDGNLANSARQDAISPIFQAINRSDIATLYKYSGCYEDPKFPEINWCVFSPFDKENWNIVSPREDKINIALYHGAIIGCKSDNGHQMTGCDESVSFFQEYDYVLMGDIHKFQFMSERQSDTGEDKPWIGYPGSLIQQNFGEGEKKGYLIWTINGKNNWDVSFKELYNYQPFLTCQWYGNQENTIKEILNERNGVVLPGTRFRIKSFQNISDVEKRQFSEYLSSKFGVEEVIYDIEALNNVDNIQTDTVKIKKISLRNNPDILIKLYNEYIINNQQSHPLNEDQIRKAEEYINQYLVKLNTLEPDVSVRDVTWSLKSLEFDNIFRYGEGNYIDFSKLNGIVGIFGPNRIGKSSIVGTMMYALFNGTDRGPMKTAFVINKNKSSCRVRAHLNVGGIDYVLERTSQKDEPKRKRKKEVDEEKTSTSLTLTQVNEDGSTISKNGISRDETDKELRRLIGTPEDFLLTSFASQGDTNRFINEGATERKLILSRFLDLDIFKKLCDYAKEDCTLLNGKLKKFSDVHWEQTIEDLKKETQVLEAGKLVVESKISEKRKELEELRLWIIQKEKDVDIASIRNLEADLESKEKQIQNVNKISSEFSEAIKIKQLELLQIEIKLNEINLDELEAKQEKLNELKDKISELESSFRVESTTLEHQEKSVRKLKLVPCGNMFPQCHFIKDSHENKQKLDNQKALVESLKCEYFSLKTVLESLLVEKISDKIKEYRNLSERKVKVEASLNDLKNRQKSIGDVFKLIAEKKQIQEKLNELRNNLNKIEEQEIQNNKEKLNIIKSDIDELESKKNEIYLKLGSNKEKLNQLVKEKDECADILQQLQIYESIHKAFAKNGIPAMILKTQLPAINAELDKILTGIVNFKVSLETDITSNVMDVFIEDDSGKRIIETASGMEKMIASLALRVALINLSSLPKSDIFILDEGFGSLDDVSLYQCMQLMSLLKSHFRIILVITHINQIKEIADSFIEIKDEGQFSLVQV